MKIILKNSSMEFRPTYEPGTEFVVNPVYSGSYALGNGYYISRSGDISFNENFVGKFTGVSDLIPVTGFSKVKVSNIITNAYAAVFAFFNSEQQTVSSNFFIYSDAEPGSIEVSIPDGALYIRVGANNNTKGYQPLGPAVYKLVV